MKKLILTHLTVVTALVALFGGRPSFGLVGGTPARDWTMEDIRKFGGKPSLKEGVFPSVVLIGTGCTADVIGRRHLKLAAHCVLNESAEACETKGDQRCHALRENFRPGSKILINTKAQWKWDRKTQKIEQSYSHRATILQTLYHHSYSYIDLSELSPQIVGDIAIVVTKEEIGIPQGEIDKTADKLDLIPIAEMSFDPVPINTAFAVKMGYGCESLDPKKAFQSSLWRLKYDAVPFPEPRDALRKATRYFTAYFNDFIDDFFHVTEGFYYSPEKPIGKSATLCAGDSGGPLWAMFGEGPEAKVVDVGLNSLSRIYDTSTPKVDEVAIDLHTRIDSESALRLNQWVKSVLGIANTKGPLASDSEWRYEKGIFYGFIIPRVSTKTETFDVREDSQLAAKAWSVIPHGLQKRCPLEVDSVWAGEQQLELRGGRWASPVEVTPKQFRVVFKDNPKVENGASLCYVSITTPTKIK